MENIDPVVCLDDEFMKEIKIIKEKIRKLWNDANKSYFLHSQHFGEWKFYFQIRSDVF